MRYITAALLLSVTACGSAQLISTRYEPVRQGTVKVSSPGPAGWDGAFEQAKMLMRDFCRPGQYKITGTDQSSQIEGAAASPFRRGAVNYTYAESPLLHFRCVDEEREPATTP